MSKETNNYPKPLIFYDEKAANYWMRLPGAARFVQVKSGDVKIHLRYSGISKDAWTDRGLTKIEHEIMETQRDRCVQYAGPLAGYRVGEFTGSDGSRLLVTSEPRADVFAPPIKAIEFPNLDKWLTHMLGPEQMPYVMAWLKYARESLRRFDFRPGQLLYLSGPSNCGKSFLQCLITEFLGGRAARPYRYMTGETPFNGDLACAEHLVIEDENASTDIRTRRKFGASIKEFSVCASTSVHPKGRPAFDAKTYKRLTCSGNSEPENVAVMPPMDESIIDKVMLIKCWCAELPYPDRQKNWQVFTSELPALDAALVQWRLPKEMKDSRFGVKAYHNKDLLELLLAISPETRLLNLIDETIDIPDPAWTGSAEQLEHELRQTPFAFAVDKLLYYSSACGVYLSRLAQKYPERFICERKAGKTRWVIKPA